MIIKIRQMNQDGFTLIEVMITLFILTFAFGGLSLFNTSMARYSHNVSNSATASLITQQKMEALINIGFENLAEGSYGPEHYITADFRSFDIEWKISASDAYKQIEVSVLFNKTRMVNLKTIISS